MAYRAYSGIDPRLLEKREFVDPSKALEAAGDAVSKIGSTIADGIDKRSKEEKEQVMYNLKKNALLDEQAERNQEFESTIFDINEFIKQQNESDTDTSNDVDLLDISVPTAPGEVDPALKGKEKRQAKKGYAAKQAQYKKDLNEYYETRYTQLGDFAKKNKIPVADLSEILTSSKNATEFGQTVVAKGAAKYYSTNGNPLDPKAKAKQRAVLSNPTSIKAVPGSDGVVRLYAVDPGAEGIEGGVIQLAVYRDGMTIDEVLGGDKTSSNLGRIDSFALEQLPTQSEALTKGDFSGIDTIKDRIADKYTDSDVNESIFESFIRTAGINLEGFKFDGILTDDEKILLQERDPGLFKYIVDGEIDGHEVANLYETKKRAQYKEQIGEFDQNKALALEKTQLDIEGKKADIEYKKSGTLVNLNKLRSRGAHTITIGNTTYSGKGTDEKGNYLGADNNTLTKYKLARATNDPADIVGAIASDEKAITRFEYDVNDKQWLATTDNIDTPFYLGGDENAPDWARVETLLSIDTESINQRLTPNKEIILPSIMKNGKVDIAQLAALQKAGGTVPAGVNLKTGEILENATADQINYLESIGYKQAEISIDDTDPRIQTGADAPVKQEGESDRHFKVIQDKYKANNAPEKLVVNSGPGGFSDVDALLTEKEITDLDYGQDIENITLDKSDPNYGLYKEVVKAKNALTSVLKKGSKGVYQASQLKLAKKNLYKEVKAESIAAQKEIKSLERELRINQNRLDGILENDPDHKARGKYEDKVKDLKAKIQELKDSGDNSVASLDAEIDALLNLA